MAKQQASQRKIFKIHSARLRRAKWNLKLSIQEAKDNEELVSLADSQTLRFINSIINKQFPEEWIRETKQEIKKIKKLETTIENKNYIKELYAKLYQFQFVKDYVCVVMDKNKDFDRANKGFFINGIKYYRLLGTNGGIKNETIIYASENVFTELNIKINNGRDESKLFVPAKLESYKALTCSASIPVTDPKGILVVHDCITHFKEKVIQIKDNDNGEPLVTPEEDYPIDLDDSDGYGLILPVLSEQWGKDLKEDYIPSGFCIRDSFCKGMLYTFDFLDFAENVAHTYIVKDIWGNEKDIRECQIILTESMLKLWDSYKSIEHYLECCNKNGYTFSVSKLCPKELEHERYLNYQFLQSLYLNDDDINELIAPTIKEFSDILDGDYRKSILFLKGAYLNENIEFDNEFDFIQALLCDKNVIQDNFIKQKIHNMIKKRIDEAKTGVIKVSANFQIISGDPYSLCQSIFELKVTGLLKKGQFYSKYWNDKNVEKVVAFRAPMTCHNNIRILNLTNTEEMQHWYQYMKTCIIFNSWDSTAQAFNGSDKDSDALLTTDNPVILRGVKETPTIFCIQNTATKKIPTEEDFVRSNKNGFGDAIGATTNRITSMFERIVMFDEDSEEYKTLAYRICCGQHFQQCAIDKIKGIVYKPMPKEWYDYNSNKIDKNDDEETRKKKDFNLKVLAERKPYFMNYIYPQQMKKYNRFILNTNKNCLMKFGLTVEELKAKENKTEDEQLFLQYYQEKMPVGNNPCIINKICWKIENEFDGYFKKRFNKGKFDKDIYKTDLQYDMQDLNAIKQLYDKYKKEIRQYHQTAKNMRISKEDKKEQSSIFRENFKEKAFEICNNEEELCNILADICCDGKGSKQFLWDICSEQIIKNLLKKNNYIINYPVLDDKGNIEFNGQKFSMQSKVIEKEVDA